MTRMIKVTGYIDPEDLSDEERDDDHEMGISNDTYERFVSVGGGNDLGQYLTDVEFEVVDE